jgi:hypothetical protein
MKKVRIESITTESKYRDFEETRIYVDDKLIGSGSYGGEPEDNTRYRDYSWVEELFIKLAKELNAEVELKQIKETDEL